LGPLSTSWLWST